MLFYRFPISVFSYIFLSYLFFLQTPRLLVIFLQISKLSIICYRFLTKIQRLPCKFLTYVCIFYRFLTYLFVFYRFVTCIFPLTYSYQIPTLYDFLQIPILYFFLQIPDLSGCFTDS